MSHAKRASPPAPGKPFFQPMDPAIMAVTIEEQRRMLERYKYTEEDMLAAIDEIHKTYKYTEDQMLKAIREGINQGWQDGYTEMLKTVYAAVAYVMRCEYGWGVQRLSRLMDEIDRRVYTTISHADIVEQLDEEYSIHMDLDDMIHRIVIEGPGRWQRKRRSKDTRA